MSAKRRPKHAIALRQLTIATLRNLELTFHRIDCDLENAGLCDPASFIYQHKFASNFQIELWHQAIGSQYSPSISTSTANKPLIIINTSFDEKTLVLAFFRQITQTIMYFSMYSNYADAAKVRSLLHKRFQSDVRVARYLRRYIGVVAGGVELSRYGHILLTA